MKLSELTTPLKIGSKVKLRHATNSIDSGQTVEIIGFVNDDITKPYSKECMPGGWINKDKLSTNVPPVRFMTILEIIINSDNPRLKIRTLDHAFLEHYRVGATVGVNVDQISKKRNAVGVDEFIVSAVGSLGNFKVWLDELTLMSTPHLTDVDYTLKLDTEDIGFTFGGGIPSDYGEYSKELGKSLEQLKWNGAIGVNEKMYEAIFKHPLRCERILKLPQYSVKAKMEIVMDNLSLYKGNNCILEPAVKTLVVSIRQMEARTQEMKKALI